jgi:hypothetical protein
MGNLPIFGWGVTMRVSWYLWVLPLLTALVYAVLVLWFGPQLQAAAGGLAPFDLRPLGYDLDQARLFLTMLTPEGREIYLGPVRVNDTVFPILFTLTLCLPIRRWHWAWALPALAYGLLDLAENMAVATLLRTGPAVESGAVAWASALTQGKFAASVVALALCFWALWLARRAR